MKKMMKYIVSLVIIIILWGCRYDKPIMPISNLDIIRVQIVDIDEGKYYYVEPSRSYNQRMDFVIFNVEIMELYNDLVGAESELEYQKGDIVKMAIPLNNKEVILNYDEFLIYFPNSKEIYDYAKEHTYNYVQVEIFIDYVTKTEQVLSGITPIDNKKIIINNEKFNFDYINIYDRYVDDEQKKLSNELTCEEFEEWFKEVYKNQRAKSKKKIGCSKI